MPPENLPSRVEVMQVQGLAGNGNVNLDSTRYGFVVFSCKGVGVETAMFHKYEKLCRQPTAEASRRRLEVDPNEVYVCFVTTTDSGTTQLAAAISEESFEEKFERNEVHAKLSKKTV